MVLIYELAIGKRMGGVAEVVNKRDSPSTLHVNFIFLCAPLEKRLSDPQVLPTSKLQ